MNERFLETIKIATSASDLREIETIQSLWSGYGRIVRFQLEGSPHNTIVAKQVLIPERDNHPRGWNTDLSHQRKLKSYQVETAWYSNWNDRCEATCRTPHCLAVDSQDNETLLVFEDLDAAGYPSRKSTIGKTEFEACLSWLASFHATFLDQEASDLWETGTYWHLETRPDELEALEDLPLKRAAASIDQLLKDSPFQTLVHGDAKLANFCFSPDGSQVAALDFQYVGRGCGMKDLAYFVGSCLDENECERQEAYLLDHYFSKLRHALKERNSKTDPEALEQNWRKLYPIAWTDFHRFLKGWSPGHWKINSYSERLARETIASINS
ncbi:MAG: phosphotransferase [Verrucomicrobiota bacterium]